MTPASSVSERREQHAAEVGVEMNAQNVHVGMMKMLSATIAFSVGVGVSFGTVIVAVAAMFS